MTTVLRALPCLLCLTAIVRYAAAEPAATPAPAKPGAVESSFQMNVNKGPTYIKANSLLLKSNERLFVYSGNVEVKHGDLTLTSDFLEGRYDEHNQIQTLTARSNVVITRGKDMRGTCQKALYEKATDTVTLTENPELQQQQSVLTADMIRIFLQQNRSTAEGNVRVKLVSETDKDGKGKDGKKKKTKADAGAFMP